MSNYTQSVFFGPKDSLTPGDALKKVKGTELDAELAAITSAVSSKADNTGPTSSFTALSAPGADRLVFWDHSAVAYAFLNPIGSNSGLTISGTSMVVDIVGTTTEASLSSSHYLMIHTGAALRRITVSQIPHNDLTGYVANEHVNHTSVTLTAGTGLSGGGTIAANRSFSFTPGILTANNSLENIDYVVTVDSSASNEAKITQASVFANYVRDFITLPVLNGGTGATTAAAARTSLGLVIGTDVQAQSGRLNFIDSMSVADGVFIVGDGSGLVAESGATVRTSIGLGSIATRNVTVSTSAPSGGADTDLWLVREA